MNTRHGWNGSQTYRIWCHMKERCLNPRNIGWKNYGGRGIKVCDRWMSFENFLADMGPRPERMTIERKDSNGNYEPENCCWASTEEQANNRSTNRKLTAFGETKSASMWAADARCGVTYDGLMKRLQYGWTDVEAITRPARFHPRRGSLHLSATQARLARRIA